MIFITGDIHGDYDIHKFNTRIFPMQRELSRSDYMIICGDFGLVWRKSADEKYWLKWLDSKPWTTLWIDGNHENFDLLKEYPTEDWHGGKVQKITENIIHLCRGSVFEIDGKKIFTFGGAESHDKEYRKLGRSIWLEEMPSAKEMEQGRKSLDLNNWQVDIVITHSLPTHIQTQLFQSAEYNTNVLTDYFEEISSRLDYKLWFSGHYHISKKYDERHCLVYNNILKLTDTGFQQVR